ncbi:MAG: hypothetical protein OHK0023_21220 [Anaerolineae bacterium]
MVARTDPFQIVVSSAIVKGVPLPTARSAPEPSASNHRPGSGYTIRAGCYTQHMGTHAVYLTNTESGAGALDAAYVYGAGGDVPLAGRWRRQDPCPWGGQAVLWGC